MLEKEDKDMDQKETETTNPTYADKVEAEKEEQRKAQAEAEARLQKLLIVRDPALGRIVEVVNVQNCPHANDAKQMCREVIEEYDIRRLAGLLASVLSQTKVNKKTGSIIVPGT